MLNFWMKLAGGAILVLLLGVLAILLFEAIWLRIGLGAAMLVIFGGLALVAWREDQRAKAARAGLERI